jgi:hypothetical protein
MNNKETTTYITVPPLSAKPDTPCGVHTMGFQNAIARHLFGRHNHSGLSPHVPKDARVAIHHFPPEHRKYLLKMHHSSKLEKWKIPISVGKSTGLTDIDLCPDKKAYFASPTRRFGDLEAEVNEAERVYAVEISTPADVFLDISDDFLLGGSGSFGSSSSSSSSSGTPLSLLRVPKFSLKKHELNTPATTAASKPGPSVSNSRGERDNGSSAANSSATPATATTIRRKTPEEKEQDRLAQEILRNPIKYICTSNNNGSKETTFEAERGE